MFLKISQYSQENTEALEALLLQNTCGGCFWIFAVANTFFQLNLVFIADSRTGFCSELLWKQRLNLRSSHWNSFVKKGVLRNFANFIGKHLCQSLFLIGLQAFRPEALLKRDSNTEKGSSPKKGGIYTTEYCFSEKLAFPKIYLFWKSWYCAEVPALKNQLFFRYFYPKAPAKKWLF